MQSIEHLDRIRTAEIERVAAFLTAGQHVLEIGAGTGRQAVELTRRGLKVTAIEIANSTYAQEREFPIVDYDGRTLPLPDASVDVVFSSNTLEHVPDLQRMHSEIRRVLKPSGYCIHAMPTHTWRFWSIVTSYLEAVSYSVSSIPRLLPWPGRSARELGGNWYRTLRHTAGLCLPRRHGERGNVVSEIWLFRPQWWRDNFRDNGFAVVHDEPMGLFYTGEVLFGMSLGLDRRAALARVLGSSCHLYKVVPAGPR